MIVADLPDDVILISDSQDVGIILADLGCYEDYSAIFISTHGIVFGMEGIVPFYCKHVWEVGRLRDCLIS